MSEPFSLLTSRLVFRPFVDGDLDELRAFHTNPDVQTGYDVEGKPWSEEAITTRLKSYISEQQEHGFSRWRLSLKSGEFIGRAGLGWDASKESVELGYGLLPDYWGHGYAQEAANALIRWGFEHLPIDKIIAFTFPHNGRSWKTLAALGMTHVDDRKRSPRDGVCAYYEITRDEAARREPSTGH